MKELPYFKFYVSEWANGNITLCSYEAQGLFTNLCSLYWSQSGCVRLADAKRRHSGCSAVAWKQLISERIIKVENDMIIINFLDEQFGERKQLSDKNRDNALKRHKKDATAQPPHSDGIAMAHNIEEKRKEERREEEKPRTNFSDDYYQTAEQAFEEVKNDELLIERLLRIVHHSGFKSCNEITLTLAVRKFMTIEDAKQTFKTKDKQGIKEHLVNWVTKHAKTLDEHAK